MALLNLMGQSLTDLLVPSASPTWHRSRPISSTRQSSIRNLATRKRFVKFSNATGSPSTNATFGIETPMGRTPFQGVSLDVIHPGLKHLGYSVRPLRGHRKMSKLQGPLGERTLPLPKKRTALDNH